MTGVQTCALPIYAAGDTTFIGKVGDTTALTSLTTDASTVAGSPAVGVGTTWIKGGVVTTTGAQTYNDAVKLDVLDVTLTSTAPGANASTGSGNGNITFAKTLDGAQNLTINTAGDTIFLGKVGDLIALTSLTTDASTVAGTPAVGLGTTWIKGGVVTTTGTQTYNDAVRIEIGRAHV